MQISGFSKRISSRQGEKYFATLCYINMINIKKREEMFFFSPILFPLIFGDFRGLYLMN